MRKKTYYIVIKGIQLTCTYILKVLIETRTKYYFSMSFVKTKFVERRLGMFIEVWRIDAYIIAFAT